MDDSWTASEASSSPTYCRPLGNSEYAFAPAATTAGVGDMFLHLSFTGQRSKVNEERIIAAWAITRARHPLLMSKLKHTEAQNQTLEYAFEFSPPRYLQEALQSARNSFQYTVEPVPSPEQWESRHNRIRLRLMNDYMNGPRRVLSSENLSWLSIHEDQAEIAEHATFHIILAAPHFIGDATSLHNSVHDMLVILERNDVEEELQKSLLGPHEWMDILPPPFESRLKSALDGSLAWRALAGPSQRPSMKAAVCRVDYARMLKSEVGGQTFSRLPPKAAAEVSAQTDFCESILSPERTRQLLKRCKEHGVTVNHVLFVLAGIAWGRTRQYLDEAEAKDKWATEPLMIYTALNLRPYLTPHPCDDRTNWFVALTYFNIVLPAFLPAEKTSTDVSKLSDRKVLFHRAALVKSQIKRVVGSPFLGVRAIESAQRRAGAWGRARIASRPKAPEDPSKPPPPSKALLGLSLIGNLDAIYWTEHSRGTQSPYPSMTLHSVTTASRLKTGGLLVLAHTFKGRLWVQVFYEREGFMKNQVKNAKGELQSLNEVEIFWSKFSNALDEFFQ
ncbi:hypothetical protein C8J56DRAFT_182434 [Mycena floridula]|nr:hypothetical protein C8J56DRAFT_182434 [Mycena floridula]